MHISFCILKYLIHDIPYNIGMVYRFNNADILYVIDTTY